MIEQERIRAEDSGGISLRIRPLVLITLFAALSFLAYAFFGQIFFQREKANPPAGRDLFKRLAIEKLEKVVQAPDFTLEDLSGKRLSLKDFRGKIVFLNFWATWCVPCREEMPMMERLYREFRDQGLQVVGVNFRESRKSVGKFFGELGLTFDSLVDSDGNVSNEYGAWSLPLSYFISRKGEFIGKAVGDRKWDSQEARAFFRDLLHEKN